jgi:pyruvate,water dikinase
LHGRRIRDLDALRTKYLHFRDLLKGNNEILAVISELSRVHVEREIISPGRLRADSTELVVYAFKIIRHLESITGRNQRDLMDRLDRITLGVEEEIRPSEGPPDNVYVLPLDRITLKEKKLAGLKAACLGELTDKLEVPVPPGFAITVAAEKRLLEQGRLGDLIQKEETGLRQADGSALEDVAGRIQSLIRRAALPQEIVEEILKAYRELADRVGGPVKVAVRSSAAGEDVPGTSFAGLHASLLNVDRDGIVQAYREVLASKFSPRALYYRLSRGIRHEDLPMAAACVAMVEPSASGVMFCNDPARDSDDIVIHALWGLGQFAGSGAVSLDRYEVDRNSLAVVRQESAPKTNKLVTTPEGGVKSVPVEGRELDRPCLTPEQVQALARLALRLESYFGHPQDIEWVIDRDGRLFILQSREQAIPESKTVREPSGEQQISEAHPPPIVEKAEVASRGAASGKVRVVRGEADLAHLVDGEVLVTPTTAPEYVRVMGRIAAIVTEHGGSTGHLAIIAREFGRPMLVNVERAATLLQPGSEVTVDAVSGRIYPGRVESLLASSEPPGRLRIPTESPVYQSVSRVLERLAPLNLTNPSSRSFRPSACMTIHDITRYAHETAINAMFELNDSWLLRSGQVKILTMGIPFRLHVIDLGGGLDAGQTGREVRPEDILSVPMRSLLRGMTAEGVTWAGHRSIDLRGFFSVFANTLYDEAKHERPLGGNSYAILGGRYVNFASRLGYHFAVVDAYCGPRQNDNYINFRFKGGAADIERRTRRARFLAKVLQHSGFWVIQKLDLVNARVKKLPETQIEGLLDMLGRLMGCARLLDVTMVNDATVDHYAEEFGKGNYTFFSGEGR